MDWVTRCCVHGGTMKSPIRTLPCLHSGCLSCLKTYSDTQLASNRDKTSRSVECPKCHEVFEVPDASLGGVTALTTSHFAASAVATAAAGAPKAPDRRKCEMCSPDGRARDSTCRCRDCSRWACDSCKMMHLKFKSSSTHRFSTADEVEKEGGCQLADTVVSLCSKHGHLSVNSVDKMEISACYECTVEIHL